MRKPLVLFVAFLLFSISVNAVGTIAGFTATPVGQTVVRYEFTWTTDASGNVSANTATLQFKPGYLRQIRFIPSGGGTQPTNNYDVTLVDGSGVDLLNGKGANLSNASGLYLTWLPGIYYDGVQTLDFVVANGGNAKSGTVVIWLAAQG
jgi:hypothetical protein